MSAKSVEVGTHRFRTIAHGIEHFKQILNSYTPGTRISPEHYRDVHTLFELHEEYAERTKGRSVAAFDILKAEGGTQCFYARYDNGEIQDFSYRNTLSYAANRQYLIAV